MTKEWIYALPKVELHCHLDGSLSTETVRELAKMSGIIVPERDEDLTNLLQVSDDCNSLGEYLEKFALPLACLQTEEALEYAAYSLIKDAAKENVIYMEVRFAPLSCMEKGLTVKQVTKSVIDGLNRGYNEFGVKSGVLICGMRHTRVERNIAMLHAAKDFLGKGICGVDIAGNEADFPPMVQKDFFEEARKLGFPITIHAGECKCASNVHDSILLGAKRVGHGIAIMNDQEIISEVKENGIGLEMCPSSNLQTKAVEDMKHYPIHKFIEEGLCVTLNTDNRMVTGTTLSNEYELMVKHFDLSPNDLIQITQNAVDCAFTDETSKQELHKIIECFH